MGGSSCPTAARLVWSRLVAFCQWGKWANNDMFARGGVNMVKKVPHEMEQSKVTLIYIREFAWCRRKRCFKMGAGNGGDSFLLYNSDGGFSKELCVVCECVWANKIGNNKETNTKTHTRADRQQNTHENCYCCCFNNVGKTNVLRQDKQ